MANDKPKKDIKKVTRTSKKEAKVVVCGDCAGRGLKDNDTLCPACAGRGKL